MTRENPGNRPAVAAAAPLPERNPSVELSRFRMELPARSTPFPRRKGFGKEGRPIQLVANYFELELSADKLYHYDVEVGSVRREGQVQTVISKDCKRRVFQLLVNQYKQELNGNLPVFDGQKNMYTKKPLGFDKKSFNVHMEEEGRDRPAVFRVTVQLAAELDVSLLQQLYNKQVTTPEVPQAVVQALDIVLRYGPSLRLPVVGRSLFKPPRGEAALGGGLELWHGFQTSIRPGQWKPFVNINTVVTAFFEAGPLLDLISKVLGDRRGNLKLSTAMRLNGTQIFKLNKTLKRLKVVATHLPYKRKYTIEKVTAAAANELRFGEPPVTVANYFASKYGRLQFANLPCIEVGSKKSYLPLEVCEVVPGQHCKRKLDENQTSAVIRKAAVPPSDRFRMIQEDIKGCNAAGKPYLDHFGIRVSDDPLKLSARVLPAPQVIYQGDREAVPNNGAWELQNNKFFKPASMTCWTIVNTSNYCLESDIGRFVSMLIQHGTKLGMTMTQPAQVTNCRPTDDPEHMLKRQRQAFPNLEVVLVVLAGGSKNSPFYSPLKNSAETVLGMVTQCVTDQSVTKRCNPATIVNILQKLNAKLGGTNNTIPAVKTIIFNRPIMIMGADVTHPAPTEMNRPSVAAVVASVDRLAFRYISTFRIQKQNTVAKARIEIIEDMKNVAKELLLGFYRINNGVKPAKIIFYRDGVSEGQFRQVQQHEVAALRAACSELEPGYQPGITFLTVQKRHHTRFMPRDRTDGCGKSGNVPPGTVVDTVITHPVDFDFFLCSHFGIQGTSRPAHYYVLWDDNDFDADSLQKLTFGLCHTYARCARSVSIPTPVYYAHHATKRAKCYVDARSEASDSSSGSGSNGSMPSTEFLDSAVKIHKVMENKMFFI